MPNKLERFTERAQLVLKFAQEEAERMQHSSIGTGHLLIGLLREEISSSTPLLRDLGFQLGRVRLIVEKAPPASPIPQNLEIAPEAKQVLRVAVAEARKADQPYIGIEHLLLAMLQQKDGILMTTLKQYGITTDKVRQEITRTLRAYPDQPATGQPDEGNSPT